MHLQKWLSAIPTNSYQSALTVTKKKHKLAAKSGSVKIVAKGGAIDNIGVVADKGWLQEVKAAKARRADGETPRAVLVATDSHVYAPLDTEDRSGARSATLGHTDSPSATQEEVGAPSATPAEPPDTNAEQPSPGKTCTETSKDQNENEDCNGAVMHDGKNSNACTAETTEFGTADDSVQTEGHPPNPPSELPSAEPPSAEPNPHSGPPSIADCDTSDDRERALQAMRVLWRMIPKQSQLGYQTRQGQFVPLRLAALSGGQFKEFEHGAPEKLPQRSKTAATGAAHAPKIDDQELKELQAAYSPALWMPDKMEISQCVQHMHATKNPSADAAAVAGGQMTSAAVQTLRQEHYGRQPVRELLRQVALLVISRINSGKFTPVGSHKKTLSNLAVKIASLELPPLATAHPPPDEALFGLLREQEERNKRAYEGGDNTYTRTTKKQKLQAT